MSILCIKIMINLPKEIQFLILKYIPYKNYGSIMLTCKDLNSLFYDDYFNKLFIRQIGSKLSYFRENFWYLSLLSILKNRYKYQTYRGYYIGNIHLETRNPSMKIIHLEEKNIFIYPNWEGDSNVIAILSHYDTKYYTFKSYSTTAYNLDNIILFIENFNNMDFSLNDYCHDEIFEPKIFRGKTARDYDFYDYNTDITIKQLIGRLSYNFYHIFNTNNLSNYLINILNNNKVIFTKYGNIKVEKLEESKFSLILI